MPNFLSILSRLTHVCLVALSEARQSTYGTAVEVPSMGVEILLRAVYR